MHGWPRLYLLSILSKWFESLLLADLHMKWDGTVSCGPAWSYSLLSFLQYTVNQNIIPF